MKKFKLITLIGLSLVLSACTNQKSINQQNKNNNLNTNQIVSNNNQNTNTNSVSDPLANWQTMTNALELPVSYKYPSTWSVYKFGGLNVGWIKGPDGNSFFTVTELIGFRDKDLSLQEAIDNSKLQNITLLKKDAKIDGYDAYLVQFQAPASASHNKVGHESNYVKYQNKIFTINFYDQNYETVTDSIYYPVYQQILSTFQIN